MTMHSKLTRYWIEHHPLIKDGIKKVAHTKLFDKQYKNGYTPIFLYWGNQSLEAAKEKYKQLTGEDYV